MLHRKARGFTLFELMIVVAVVGVLAVLAYPSYMDSIRKSRRADGVQALRSLQLKQERWRANNPNYGTLANLGITSATTTDGWYTLAISNLTATGYTATATAVAGKSQIDDKSGGVSCSTLTVNQDAPVYNPAGQAACWGK